MPGILLSGGPENLEERLVTAPEIVRLAEETDDRERALLGHQLRLIDLLELGEVAAVDREIGAHARIAAELRQPLYLQDSARWKVMRVLLEGRFDEAERLAQEALVVGQRVNEQNAIQSFVVQIGELRREQGRLQELEVGLQSFVERYPAVPSWRCALAYVYSQLGRDAEARSEFAHLAANDFTDLPRGQQWLVGVTFLSEVCASLGDARRAATLYALLLPYAGRVVVVGGAVTCYGSASRSLGLLAATMARWEEAERHFADALRMNAKMRARPWLAHTQHEYATMLLTRDQPGDRGRARELLDSALHTAQELGMKSLEEKIKLQVAGFRFQVHSAESRSQELEEEKQKSKGKGQRAKVDSQFSDARRWTLDLILRTPDPKSPASSLTQRQHLSPGGRILDPRLSRNRLPTQRRQGAVLSRLPVAPSGQGIPRRRTGSRHRQIPSNFSSSHSQRAE